MDNFLEHIKQLHNKELLLTSAESQQFTKMLLQRPRDGGPPLPFFAEKGIKFTLLSIYNTFLQNARARTRAFHCTRMGVQIKYICRLQNFCFRQKLL